MRYQFIKEHQGIFDIKRCCKVLSVSRSGYYAWIKRPESARAQANMSLSEKIKQIFASSRSTYGYRRIFASLNHQGKICGKHRVARIMKQEKLIPKAKKKFRATTNSKHSLPVYENHLNRNFSPKQSNQAWASDITYIHTEQGWLYLAVVLDLYSRQVIGWGMSHKITQELVIEATKMALSKRTAPTGLIFHSDRGSQYAAEGFQNLLRKHGIVSSMSRKGNCWDNAPTESFFGTLKAECIYHNQFKTIDEAKTTIFDYVELFYNRQRKHSTLNYRSPLEFENQC